MNSKEALRVIVNDSNAGKATINALLIPHNGDIESATQVYLFPNCCRLNGNTQYCVGWCPSMNKFMAISLANRTDLKYVKRVDAYIEKQKAAEQYFEESSTQHVEIDKAIDLLCGGPNLVFDQRISAKISDTVTHTLLCITAGRMILPETYKIIIKAISEMIKALPTYEKCLSVMLTMITEYNKITTDRNKYQYEKHVVEQYKRLIDHGKQLSLLNLVPEEDKPFQLIDNDAPEDPKIVKQRKDFQCNFVLIQMVMSRREFVSVKEIKAIGVEYFPHLEGEPINECVTCGIKTAHAAKFVEYCEMLDMYRLVDAGRHLAIVIMENDYKRAKL